MIVTPPVDFIPWDRPSPLLDRLGDFRRHRTERGTFGFLVDEPKLKARGLLHAGAISTIADVCIGHTLARETDPPTLTVNLNTNFIGTVSGGGPPPHFNKTRDNLRVVEGVIDVASGRATCLGHGCVTV